MNNIGNFNGEKYLILFIPYAGNSDDVEVNFDVDYCIFPGRLNVRVFGVGQAYDSQGHATDKYRYETHIQAYASLEAGKNYQASLQGYVCNVYVSEGRFSKKSVTLTGELYSSNDSNSFYPLSNGNVPVLQTYSGGDETINNFIFSNIMTPLEDSNTMFMCTSPCDDLNTLLVVRTYDFGFSEKKD